MWGTGGVWQKHWWKRTDGEDAASTDARLGEQSSALGLWTATEKDPLWLSGCLHHLCLAWRLESRAFHWAGIKAGVEEEERGRWETVGGPCACCLSRKLGFRNRAPVTGTI